MAELVRHWASWLRWTLTSVGYWIRPYDMIADARRWRVAATHPLRLVARRRAGQGGGR